MVFRNKQISDAFYKKFIHFRDLMARNIIDNITFNQKLLETQKIFYGIFVIQFLCSNGLIRINEQIIQGKDLFSYQILNNGKFLENYYDLLSLIKNPIQRTKIINGYEIIFPLLNEGLFHLIDSERNQFNINLSQNEWEKIFVFLNSFEWDLEEENQDKSISDNILTPEIFGYIYERNIVDSEGIKANDSQTVRKLKGIFYTPVEITEYICKNTIFKHFSRNIMSTEENFIQTLNELDSKQEGDLLRSLMNEVENSKILDPACGSGAFLIRTAQILLNIKKLLLSKLSFQEEDYDIKARIITDNLYGIDINKGATEISKLRLLLWLISSAENKIMIETLPNIERNIIVGNSLTEEIDEKLKSLKFRGFDIIFGNPPYVFIRGMGFDKFEKTFYIQKYLKSYSTLTKGKAKQSGKINLFSLFIIRSIELMKNNGVLGFIVPNTLLRTTTNDIVRQFIVDKTFIQEIVDLEGGIFSGVTASTVIMILRKGYRLTKELTTIKFDVKNLLENDYSSHQISQSRFKNNIICCFNIHVNQNFQKYFERMRIDTFKLGDISKQIIEGLVARKKDKLFTDNPIHPLAKKLLRGKDIDRYVMNWKSGQFIIFDQDKLHRSRPIYVHEAPEKLITQRIGGGKYPLRVVYDNEQYYIFASTNAIILKQNPTFLNVQYTYKYILALLNSKLINAYYLLNFSNRSSLTVNISKTFLEVLPIKVASEEIQEVFTKIVDYLLFLNKNYRNERKLIDYFDQIILESMVFELYFTDHFLTKVIDLISKNVLPIDLTDDNSVILKKIEDCYQYLNQLNNLTDSLKNVNTDHFTTEVNKLFKTRTQ